MRHSRHILILWSLSLVTLLASCRQDPYSYRRGRFSDKFKDITISFELRKGGKGMILVQVDPSYDSVKSKRKIPRIGKQLHVLWEGNWEKMRIMDAQGRDLGNVQSINGVSVFTFKRLPTVLTRKEYGVVPLRYEIKKAGRRGS